MWRAKFKANSLKLKFFLISLLLVVPAATRALEVKQPAQGEQDVRVSGELINDNLLAVGTSVVVDVPVSGDLIVLGQTVEVNAPVAGNIFAAGGTLKLNEPIKGDAFIAAARLAIGEKGNIGNDLYYYGGTPSDELKSKVGGNLISPKPVAAPTAREKAKDSVVAGLTLLFTGIVLLRIFPKTVNSMAANLLPNWGKNFLAGVVTLIVAPIVAGFLIVSSIGAPVGLVLLALWLWELYVALVVAAYTIGRFVLRKHSNDLVQYAAGVVVVTVVSFLPGVNQTVKFALVLFGLGSIVLTKYELYKDLRSRL